MVVSVAFPQYIAKYFHIIVMYVNYTFNFENKIVAIGHLSINLRINRLKNVVEVKAFPPARK